MFYNYFLLIGELVEIHKDNYITLRVERDLFLIQLDQIIEKPTKDHLGKLMSVKGKLLKTNLIELIAERIDFGKE